MNVKIEYMEKTYPDVRFQCSMNLYLFLRYHFYVDCTTAFDDGDKAQHRKEFGDEIYLIFNPWCEGL